MQKANKKIFFKFCYSHNNDNTDNNNNLCIIIIKDTLDLFVDYLNTKKPIKNTFKILIYSQ